MSKTGLTLLGFFFNFALGDFVKYMTVIITRDN
jgi:hypothetical protein